MIEGYAIQQRSILTSDAYFLSKKRVMRIRYFAADMKLFTASLVPTKMLEYWTSGPNLNI